MARLLGGASLAVLATYGPAMAQAVNITIDSAQVAPASAFTAANVTGFETVANSTQDSRAAVTASIVSGVLNSDIAGSGSSAVGIEDNALTATATGNVFTLDADQLGSDGGGAAGTLATLSGQFADGTVSTAITGSSLTIDGTGDATATSLAASDNTLSATTTVNNATSVFSDTISADLAGDLAQAQAAFITSPITLTGGDLTAQQLLSVEGGGSVVASTQAVEGAGLASTATITGSGISVSLGDLDATGSALSVDGNDIRASLTGNRASIGTDLTVDTTFDNTAAVLTQQQLGDGTTDVGLVSTADTSTLSVALDNATGSSLTVSSNTIGAQANGNVATLSGAGAGATVADGTFLRVDANTISSNTAGGEINNDLNSVVTFDDGAAANPGFGFVAGSQQAIESTAANAGTIQASSDGNSLSVTAADSAALGGALSGSNISVTDNTAFALASANTGGTAIDLSATSITATAGLASDQTLRGTDVDALLGDTGAFALSVTAEGDVTSSSILVDGNLSVAEASGNTGQTLLRADADTALLSNTSTDRGTGTVDTETTDSAATATTVDADFGVSANQAIVGSDVASTAVSSFGVTIGETGIASNDAGAIDASTISLSSNVQQATTSGNTLTNRIDLDANVIGALDTVGPVFADNSSAVSSLVSLQSIDSATSAASTTTLFLRQDDFATADTTSINASSLAIGANQNRSTTTANRVTNMLDVTADTAIIGADSLSGRANVETTATGAIGFAAGTSGLTNFQVNSGATVDATTTANAGIRAGGAGATVASLADSSASISDNITTASGASNIGASSITLNAGTETTSNAALTSVQDSSADVTAASTFDVGTAPATGINLTGAVSDSTVGVDNNVTVSSAMGNQNANTVSVTATTIDRASSTLAGNNNLFFAAADSADVRAEFAALNVQSQTGNISSTGVVDGLIGINVATGSNADLINSSATLDGNVLQSDAMSNLATNRVALAGTAAITETTTGLASVQTSGTAPATPITIGSSSTATFNFVQTDGNGDVINSTVSIDGNQSFDTATSNRATNTVSLAGNAISGEAANLAAVGVTLQPQVGAQVLADNTLSSVQTSVAAVTSASQITGTADTGGLTTTDSSLSISDNFARSFGMGNDAANVLSILADTSAAGASALSGTQVQIGNVSATAGVTATLDLQDGPVGSAVDSTLATDGNIGFARAMGNNQTNTLSIAATEVDGVSVAGENASFAALGDVVGTNRVFAGDNILTAFQGLVGDVAGVATVTTDTLVADTIDGSSVSASQNIAQSNVTGNVGNNLLSLAADTDVTGLSVLTSEQSGGATSDVTSTAGLNFTLDLAAAGAVNDVVNSALNVDGNLGFSTAFGNDVTNRLTATGTTVTGQDNTALSSVSIAGDDGVGTIATGTVSGTSDNLLGNFQTRTGGQVVTSAATLQVDLLATTGSAPGDAMTGSSATLSGNTLDSTATSNRANNTLALNAATVLTAGGAIANQQNSDSAVTSDVSLRGSLGSATFTDATGSSIALRDNTGIARAAGNDATNVLNASAGTAMNALFAGTAGATVGTGTPGALNATGTFASASNQVNSGAVTARASFGATPANPVSSLGVQTAALNSSSVDLSGNRLVADAVSNRVANTISISGRSPSTDVSTALTSRQVASGAVTSSVVGGNVSSANGALDASSARLGGNTFSASASGNIATSRLLRD
ncbi:beta strand repeat-containing protein [Roseovarius mucosus]|nr:S-layer family protein [Roseovarius mucosus]